MLEIDPKWLPDNCKLISSRKRSLVYQIPEGILKITNISREAELAILIHKMDEIHPMLPKIFKVKSLGKLWGIWRENLADVTITCCDIKRLWHKLNSPPRRKHSELDWMTDFAKSLPTDLIECHFQDLLDFHLWLARRGITIRDAGLHNWGHRISALVIRDFGDCLIKN